jgi:thiol-disulfide isomerase/thioredoxin
MAGSSQAITCKLEGQIIGRDSKTLILFRATEDPDRDTKTFIPINNGKFEYTLTAPYTEAYFLIFQDDLDMGSYRYIYFFPENGTTVFKLHSYAEREQDEITGGKLTSEYYNYFKLNKDAYRPQKKVLRDSIAELKKRDEYFSIEFKLQQNKLNEAMAKTRTANSNENDYEISVAQTQVVQNMINRGEYVTQKGKALNDKMDSIIVLENRHRLDYIQNNPSLVSYFFLIQDTKEIEACQGITVSDIKSIVPIFTDKYPDHPYTKKMAVMVESLLRIKVGSKFYDFSAPDLNGKLYKVSEIIDGKYAVIDLWASWCGPCINGSRNLLSIYEEFKEKGFTICAVAREYKNTDALKYRIEKEKFPWINLVEMDDKNQIWLHYNVQGGGRKFLVDNKGIILAIEPSVDEIRKILSEKLIK